MTAAVLIPAARRLVVADPLRRVEVMADGPRFLSTHWGGECAFAMRALDFDDVVHFGLPAAGGLFEDGGHEFAVVLARRPASNRVRFSCGAAGLRFFRQPDGSHAVYHASRAGNFLNVHYRAGKAFHVLRPWAEDAAGWRVWCDLRMPKGGTGLATVVVPQAFLDSASYPVLVDPTFGYTTAGATEEGPVDWSSFARSGQISTRYSGGGTATLYSFYARRPGSNVTLQIAAYTVVSSIPNTKTGATQNVAVTSSTAQWWNSSAISVTLASGTAYVTCAGCATTATTVSMYYDSGGAGESCTDISDTSLPPSWLDSPPADARLASQYATYNTGATPPAAIVAPVQAVQRAASW